MLIISPDSVALDKDLINSAAMRAGCTPDIRTLTQQYQTLYYLIQYGPKWRTLKRKSELEEIEGELREFVENG